jgi:hypothetical protein
MSTAIAYQFFGIVRLLYHRYKSRNVTGSPRDIWVLLSLPLYSIVHRARLRLGICRKDKPIEQPAR